MESHAKRILLIGCGSASQGANLEGADFDPEHELVTHPATLVPIACATIAALTPDDYHVDIWDENLRGPIRHDTPLPPYAIVGVSLMFSHLGAHARQLGMMLRERGLLVVAGGPGISAAPEQFRGAFDAIFVNEAERTWPQFLRDVERGEIKPEYRQIEKPSMTESPKPNFQSVAADVPLYEMGAVQTTRGCPFDCEFCDVIYLYGRRQRHKHVTQVLEEVRTLEALGSRGIYFTDDEFVGDPSYAKELLSALVPLNNSFQRPLWFYTQLTLNLSRDDELLALAADANFYSALVGIESFNKESLRETGKHHHAVRDILRDVRHIQSHGIGLFGMFIVGFDHDGPEVFEKLYEGIQQACLPRVLVNRLWAHQNTRLWVRLRAEGRVATVRLRRNERGPMLGLNIIPGGMSRVELLEGYRGLCDKLHTWEATLTRLRGWISNVNRPPRVREEPYTDAMLDRFLAHASRSWELSARERTDIGDTLSHAKRVAPYLLGRLVYFIAQNHLIRLHIKQLLVDYHRLIELERSGDLVQDTRPIVIPSSFGPAMAELFPELLTRLARGLHDEHLIADAMREVFVEFIARWGSTFRELEPEHRVFLLDLCDREAAKLGGQPSSAPREGESALLRDARKGRLLEAVLKDVRDVLATARPAS